MTRFLRFAVGIATALNGSHEKGLIHKDVNPAMFSSTGDRSGSAHGFWDRFALSAWAPDARTSRVHSWNTSLHGSRTNRADGLVHAHIARQPTLPFAKLNSAELSIISIHGIRGIRVIYGDCAAVCTLYPFIIIGLEMAEVLHLVDRTQDGATQFAHLSRNKKE